MSNIREILKKIELHDSALESLTVKNNGSVELLLDIDRVWNKNLSENINGIVFKSVYEVLEFKIDRLNIIDSVAVVDIEGYNKKFLIHGNNEPEIVFFISIDFVAGGQLNIICSGAAEFLLKKPF